MLRSYHITNLAQMRIHVKNNCLVVKTILRKSWIALLKIKHILPYLGRSKMSSLSFEYKEAQQENYILNSILDIVSTKLADAETEKSVLKFESNNANLIKQHLLGIFSFYSSLVEKLNQAVEEDKIKREFAQEENTLFEIVRLLSENVGYLEKINQQLEHRIHVGQT